MPRITFVSATPNANAFHGKFSLEFCVLYLNRRNDQSLREVDEETQDSPAPLEKIEFKRRRVAVMSGSEGEESEEARGTRPWAQLSPFS
ncbi:hypothetical protein Q7C36_001475 [Tachysurus vachellii]|uniref:Uncharacterized protein n=1 Tax=Tachysurus vachellii TaxID=175792 RepID=A0AA88PBT1_TACVA|nr:hypothetical protein Q7C36_001475 [Tachysurus vachellii]